MGRETLLKLLHISDLHLGRLDPYGSGNAEYSSLYLAALSRLSFLDGLLGHHFRALQDIEAFYQDLKRQHPELQVVVTGDLSRCGDLREFDLGYEFITNSIQLGSGLSAGLNLPHPPFWISGNHDHWGGIPYPGLRVPSNVPQGVLPFDQRMPGNPSVLICGIDSDADITLTVEKLLAQGNFESQLTSLDQTLQAAPPTPKELRILLVHHSVQHADTKGWGRLEMNPRSKARLLAFCKTHKFAAILTGHTHGKFVGPLDPTDQNGPHEYCCGSSSQIDSIPLTWRVQWGGRFPQLHANTVMVHTIEDDDQDGKRHWTTRTFFRTNANGFNNQLGPDDSRVL